MAIRLEKSGGLIVIRGSAPERKKPGWWSRNHRDLALWVALTVLLLAALFVPAEALRWEAIDHTVKGLMNVFR